MSGICAAASFGIVQLLSLAAAPAQPAREVNYFADDGPRPAVRRAAARPRAAASAPAPAAASGSGPAAFAAGSGAVPPLLADAGVRPLTNGRVSLLAAPQALVLLFQSDASSAEATRRFNEWYQNNRPAGLAAYGVVALQTNQNIEVVREALAHRELRFPVFAASRDLTNGAAARLVALRGTDAPQDFPTLDFAAASKLLAERTGGATSNAAPAPAAANTAPVDLDAAAPAPAGEPTAAAAPKQGTYTNQRYGFTIDFPETYAWRESQNGDGAVGKVGPGAAQPSQLDFRAWASPAESAESGEMRSLKNFLTQHFEMIEGQTKSRVTVDRRLMVEDNGHEGQDVSYSFLRTLAADDPGALPGTVGKVRFRGRVQVFRIDGQFKAASVEGPGGEFGARQAAIEKFLLSFRPFVAAAGDDAAEGDEAPVPAPFRAPLQ